MHLKKFIPIYLKSNPGAHKVKAGLACSAIHTVAKRMNNDDFVLCPDGQRNYKIAKISGDYSPIHMDIEYASTTSFKKRVVHGMLLASFFSRIDGMYLPGKHALYFSQTLKFVNPCFIDDLVTVQSEVIEKSDSTQIITINSQIINE